VLAQDIRAPFALGTPRKNRATTAMSHRLIACGLATALLAAISDSAEASSQRKSSSKRQEVKKEQVAPKGPVIISISISNQHLTVFDQGVAIAHAPVSTGMAGHPTPMGVFSIIQKQKWHESNIYSGAPMPYMQRITWSGVAMHAGVLPGYPASHGCIRMPHDFAVRLYGMTKMGARVFVTRNDVTPTEFANSRLFTPKPAEDAQANFSAAPAQVVAAGRAGDRDAQPELVPAKAAQAAKAVVVANAAGGPIPVQSEKPEAATADAAHAEGPGGATAADEVAPKVAADPVPKSSADSLADPPAKASDDPVLTKEPSPASIIASAEIATPIDVPLPVARPQIPPFKPGPISIFISKKLGKLFVRKGFETVFNSSVTVADPERALGTHVFTATGVSEDRSAMHWLLVSLPNEPLKKEGRSADGSAQARKKRDGNAVKAPIEAPAAETAAGALARIEIPQEARDRPSSSPTRTWVRRRERAVKPTLSS
jgi:hypothetical protein